MQKLFYVLALFLGHIGLFVGRLYTLISRKIPNNQDRCADLFKNTFAFSNLSVVWNIIDSLDPELLFDRPEGAFLHQALSSDPHNLTPTTQPIKFMTFSDPPAITIFRMQGLLAGGDGSRTATERLVPSSLHEQLLTGSLHKNTLLIGPPLWQIIESSDWGLAITNKHLSMSRFAETDHSVHSAFLQHLNQITKTAFTILHYIALDDLGHFLATNRGKEYEKVVNDQVLIYKDIEGMNKLLIDSRILLVTFSDHGHNNDGGHFMVSRHTLSAIQFSRVLIPNGLTINDMVNRCLRKLLEDWNQTRSEMSVRIPTLVEGNRWLSEFERSKGVRISWQTDLTPTTAVLTGVPIPSNNLGVVLPEVILQVAATHPDACKGKNFDGCLEELNNVLHAALRCNARQYSMSYHLNPPTNATPVELWRWHMDSRSLAHEASSFTAGTNASSTMICLVVLMGIILARSSIPWREVFVLTALANIVLELLGISKEFGLTNILKLGGCLLTLTCAYGLRRPFVQNLLNAWCILLAVTVGCSRFYNWETWNDYFRLYALIPSLVLYALAHCILAIIFGWRKVLVPCIVLALLCHAHKPFPWILFSNEPDVPFTTDQLSSIVPEAFHTLLHYLPTAHVMVLGSLVLARYRRNSTIVAVGFALWFLIISRSFEFHLRLLIMCLFLSMKPLAVAVSKRFGTLVGAFLIFLNATLSYTLEYHHSTSINLDLRSLNFGLPFEALPLGVLIVLLTTGFPLLLATWTAIAIDSEPGVVDSPTSSTEYFLGLMIMRCSLLLLVVVFAPRGTGSEEFIPFTLAETLLVLIVAPLIRQLLALFSQ